VKVFLSYDSEQLALAQTLTQRLEAAGHSVFLDRDDVAAGDAYDRRIAAGVAAADAMVFLASATSVAPGAYALSELKLAEQRWPNPEGRLIGVVLPGMAIAAVPAYLRSVSLLQPQGDIAAEVVHAVQVLARRRRRRQVVGATLAAAVGAVALATWQWRSRPPSPFEVVSATVAPNGDAYRLNATLRNGSERRVTSMLLAIEADREGTRFPSSHPQFDLFPGQQLAHAHDFEVRAARPGEAFRWRLCWTSVDALEVANLRNPELLHELVRDKGHRACTPWRAWTLALAPR